MILQSFFMIITWIFLPNVFFHSAEKIIFFYFLATDLGLLEIPKLNEESTPFIDIEKPRDQSRNIHILFPK